MKRYLLLLSVLTILALAMEPALAVFPKPDAVPKYNGTKTFKLNQGWFDDTVTWFIYTDTNNIRWASTPYLAISPKLLTLCPKLTSALEEWPYSDPDLAAREMIVVLNYNQGPVFSTRPTTPGADPPDYPDYSGLWQITYITWLPTATKRPITNTDDASVGNPTGVPDATEVTEVESGIVVNCPIMAIGALGGPWYPAPLGRYRIKQAKSYSAYGKTITLPYYLVYADNPITWRVSLVAVIITDSSDATQAALLGANEAPGLLHMPPDDTQAFWYQNDPKPPFQYPVIEDAPTAFSWRNTNYGYSPIMDYIVLDRDYTPPDDMARWTIVTNDRYLQLLITGGRLDIVSGPRVVINAPVVP